MDAWLTAHMRSLKNEHPYNSSLCCTMQLFIYVCNFLVGFKKQKKKKEVWLSRVNKSFWRNEVENTHSPSNCLLWVHPACVQASARLLAQEPRVSTLICSHHHSTGEHTGDFASKESHWTPLQLLHRMMTIKQGFIVVYFIISIYSLFTIFLL